MSVAMPVTRVLAGLPPSAGAEGFTDHVARLGPLPPARDRRELIGVVERSGLLGRGGAGFPVGRKWRSVAERSRGRAVVLVNGAEGEPASAKDRCVMTYRPHLVIDGAVLAAEAVGADEIILYVGEEHAAARAALGRAVAERGSALRLPVRLAIAPRGYVSGEESAAVHYVNAGDARPTTTPPRPYERGIDGRPTLVQNVESLAHAALIARYGDAWYASAGRGETRGTALITIGGDAPRKGVHEIELGTTVGEVAELAQGVRSRTRAVLLGGYFGAWASADEAWSMPLDPLAMRAAGRSFGCGVVSLLGADTCGVTATARIMGYLAGQSARQCGPCLFGLAAIAGATQRIADRQAEREDLARLTHWAGQVTGRGACRHPDGAVGLLLSGLRVFADEFSLHQRSRLCSSSRTHVAVA